MTQYKNTDDLKKYYEEKVDKSRNDYNNASSKQERDAAEQREREYQTEVDRMDTYERNRREK